MMGRRPNPRMTDPCTNCDGWGAYGRQLLECENCNGTGRRVRRVRQSRQPGRRLPWNTRSVARPSTWGNPYRVESIGCQSTVTGPDGVSVTFASEPAAREHAVFLFEMHVIPSLPVRDLEGINLACWCPLPNTGEADHCHAAVLLHYANTPKEPQ